MFALELILTLEQGIALLLLPHGLRLLSSQEPRFLSTDRNREKGHNSERKRDRSLDDKQPPPGRKTSLSPHLLNTVGNQTAKCARDGRCTVYDRHSLGLLLAVPDGGDDEDHAGQEAGLEGAQDQATGQCLAVVVAETGRDGRGAPAEHCDAEDAVGAEALDGDDPENITDDVGDLLRYTLVYKLE